MLDSISGTTVPVGYPVEGQEIYLQDNNGINIEGPGSGEIAVRSSFLSTGYWKQPELTEKAYSRDFQYENKRVYRTGDLGELDTDGCLTYLGRKDFQVQIGGFRVEVAEVETTLNQLDTILESIVVGEPLDDGGHELVAYLVSKKQPGRSVSSLRQALKEKLPEYMIPSFFISLDHLPRAANGKLLRNQVKDMSQFELAKDKQWLPPKSPTEKLISEIWEEVLKIEKDPIKNNKAVGVTDNFFELGGNSLNATQVISRV